MKANRRPRGWYKTCQFMHYKGCRRRRDREMDQKCIWKIMDGNFPNLEKETDFQAQETQRVKNKINPNRDTKKHIINMQKLTIKTEFKEARKNIFSKEPS